MDEKKKKKEYQKKLNSKKLKKSQEYKTLSFTTGISLVFALLFAFSATALLPVKYIPFPCCWPRLFWRRG